MKDGPGFYVRNRFVNQTIALELSIRQWATNYYGPMARAEDCLQRAASTFNSYSGVKLDYLLPVQIVQAESRDQAERGGGIVWWSNGKVATGLMAKAIDAPRRTP